ncbi:MAG TPA: helix-turn-helix transcriptional regulator [Bryobacteraceae bacterium]|jgi:DNA-binding PadR family transcriptional regulator
MKYRPAIQSFLPLKPHWFHVLLSLAAGEQHGYAIMQEVLDRTDGKVRLWPATLYGTLKRLMEDNLVEETAAPTAADPRRRYYRLTRLGREVLDAECARLEELVRMIHARRGLRERKLES